VPAWRVTLLSRRVGGNQSGRLQVNIYYGICPHCDQGKAVSVALTTVDNGMTGYWADSYTSADSRRVPDWDECRCEVIAEAEDTAINDPREPILPD
jgi:hypothetical protein